MYASVVKIKKVTRFDCQMAIQKHISATACSTSEFNDAWDTAFSGMETIHALKFHKERLADELAVIIANNVGGGTADIFHQSATEHKVAWEERVRTAKEIVLLALEEVF